MSRSPGIMKGVQGNKRQVWNGNLSAGIQQKTHGVQTSEVVVVVVVVGGLERH